MDRPVNLTRCMRGSPKISVVIPVHSRDSWLPQIRRSMVACDPPSEIIIVLNNKELEGAIFPEHPWERVIICEKRGRGYAIVAGVKEASGDIILILHSDTMLPIGWQATITRALEDPRVAGGGFTLSFDMSSLYLSAGLLVSRMMFNIFGEMTGDRAMFARADVMRKCLPVMDVPFFEDVRLAYEMRKYGKSLLLKDKVVTRADAFRKNGKLGHSWRIAVCHIWYALGGSTERLYEYYYRK